jgi:hypothetical protein
MKKTLRIGLCLVACWSVNAKESTPINDGVVNTIYELETLFVEQQYQFLPISPPSEKVYIHSHKTVVPVDWKRFPKEFSKQMYAEMDANGYPIYRVSIYEDPAARETVFLNSYGTEAYRLEAEKDYDPFAWQTINFQLESGQVLDDWSRWLYDPAHIAASFVLIPEVFQCRLPGRAGGRGLDGGLDGTHDDGDVVSGNRDGSYDGNQCCFKQCS